MTQRFAIYYAPAADDPLWVRAAEWLGRDPLSGRAFDGRIAGIDRSRLLPLTASARRYGFHATIKQPIELADGVAADDLAAALADFAADEVPVPIGQLHLASIDGFLALIPEFQRLGLTAFAGRVVERLDRFRAPLSDAERARRTASPGLTQRQIELIDFYGYPYVLEQFKFHMTVTDRLAEADRPSLEEAAGAWFEEDTRRDFMLDRLVMFREAAPGEPFTRGAEFILGARQ